MAGDFLFVYGTLRTKTTHKPENPLVRHLTYLSHGFICGKLFEVNGYPGATLSGDCDSKVFGELVRLKDPDIAFPKLDRYEECSPAFPEPHEYVRKKCRVFLSDGTTSSAWVYVFNRDTTGFFQILSGDYLKFLSRES